jgi:hypothetical protein
MTNRLQLAQGLAVLAALGCLLGVISGSGSAQSAIVESDSVAVGDLMLEYPARWEFASKAAALPGLRFLGAVALGLGGNASSAGLVAGQLVDSQESPLPSSFLATLSSAPHGEVVEGFGVQAYRYRLRVGARGDEIIELYVQPSPGQDATAWACYAPISAALRLRECAQVFTTVRQAGTAEGLAPDRRFASSLSAVLAALEQTRVPVRAQLSTVHNRAAAAGLAQRLAPRLTAAAQTLEALALPPVLDAIKSRLVHALDSAGAGYLALARSASAGSASGYASAQAQISRAEQGVDSTLERFALYGYTAHAS